MATGLALTLFGLGLSALIGQSYVGIRAPAVPDWNIPLLADIPVLGPIALPARSDGLPVARSSWPAVWAFLKYTRAGLILRAVGESHDSAHALGYKVVRIRMAAIAFGGACAGLGGAYLSLVRVPQWTEGMTAGAGWIALAIVVFAVVEAGARSARCLSFRRHHRAATQPAGGGREGAGRNLVDVAVSDNDPRAGHHLGRPVARGAECARLPRPDLPCLELRPFLPSRGHGEPRQTGSMSREKKNPSCLGCRRCRRLPPLACPPGRRTPLKVGFVYVGPIGDGGWTFQHDQGRLAVEAEFGDAVETIYQESVPEGADAERVHHPDGAVGLRTSSSPRPSATWTRPTTSPAKFPDVKFEHATGYKRDHRTWPPMTRASTKAAP